MWNDYLNILGCAFNLFGTILAVLSILKMRFSDIWNTATVGYFDSKPLPTLQQVFQARLGIIFVSGGCFSQIWSIIKKNLSQEEFTMFVILILVIMLLSLFGITIIHKKTKKKIIEKKSSAN